MTISDLPTPSLLVEQSRLQDNLAAMQAQADANEVALRNQPNVTDQLLEKLDSSALYFRPLSGWKIQGYP